MSENPYRRINETYAACWREGFEAGRASRDGDVKAARSTAERLMRDNNAALERMSAQLAEKEAECERLRRICEYAAEAVAAHGRMSERWNPNHVAESFEKDVKMLRAAASKGEGDG